MYCRGGLCLNGRSINSIAITIPAEVGRRPMTEKQQPECTIESDGLSLFVVFDGVRIAKRGEPSTPQAGTWVSLEPGYEVTGGDVWHPASDYTSVIRAPG
jgi:hypothetical protein